MSQVKSMEQPISGAYNPLEVEAKWTQYWFDNNLFDTRVEADRPVFSCALPPPNITGNLHMGHALNGTIQDVLTRWKRMQGYNVLWQPGTDHAGISTQMVVERNLKKQGITRHQLGRDEFIKKCWEWREQYGNTIFGQYRRLGVSFAWDRQKFTLDPDYVRAIYRAFVVLFKEGKIYRGNRVTNWCPRCLTSLSDLEVEHEETKGFLYSIKYALAKSSGGTGEPSGPSLIVATTRPESIFGDVAVAVNPKDERYSSYIGKHVVLPLTDREIPIIADEYVDVEFGTGALKVTPAHDPNDWEIGQRHNLPQPQIIDKHGKLMDSPLVPEAFRGEERFQARKSIVQALEEKSFMEETKDYVTGLGFCERCHTAIEPYLSDQWYLRMQELAAPAIQVVEEGRVQFIPDRYSSTYLDWMRKIRDWNISRQLWWGHRIPVWTCDNGHVDAYETPPDSCDQCKSKNLEQDQDVLDTWFSSALWPFATLGWPEKSAEMSLFYPTTILSTAREIINLWVARMIFMGIKFVGVIPFKHVLIHPVIQTSDGKRMSKSKGNAVDPLDMIDAYGADANRFWFASLGVKGDQDVRFREDRLDEYKRFANKLWNAGKLVLDKLKDYQPNLVDPANLTLPDRWILHRYTTLLKGLQTQFHNYDFSEASQALYVFIWDYFCDWYLEVAKLQLNDPKTADSTRDVLYYIFEGLMRALHPIMPFITEEMWEKLPLSEYFLEMESLMFAPYPRPDERFVDGASDAEMELLIRTVRSVRNIRQTFNVEAKAHVAAVFHVPDDAERATISSGKAIIKELGRLEPLTIEADGSKPDMAASATVSGVRIYIPLGNVIDIEKTRAKLLQQREAVLKDIAKIKQTLDNPDFLKRAPADKVAIQTAALDQAQKQLEAIDSQLKLLES